MLALAALALAVPLHFEQNRGQWDSRVRFEAVTPRYTLELSDTAIAMNFSGGSLRLNLPRAKPEGVEELPGKSNYYFGADRSRWRTGISNFARIRYRNVFRGVDLAVYGRGGEIEYDWILAPEADPRSIRFSFTGAKTLRVDSNGDLVIETGAGEIRHTRPRILQANRPIPGQFALKGNEVRFEIADYDRSKPLIIDPVLVVNTSFGGSGISYDFPGSHTGAADTGTGIATDSSGNIYIAGTTFSTDFPQVNSTEPAPSQKCFSNCAFSAVFVTKLSPDGTTVLYSTYIGAPSAPMQGYPPPPLLSGSMAVDSSGVVYVTGMTAGVNFPGVTATAGGEDAFLLRLDSKGALLGTLLFGGSGDDMGTSLVLGPDGFVYIAGLTQSADFPVTPNAYRAPPTMSDVFVAKISFTSFFGPTNGSVIYSAVVGPGVSSARLGYGFAFGVPAGNYAAVAADASGNAYIASMTDSNGWPTTPTSAQATCGPAPCTDIVLAKLDPLGQRLVYAAYLGGSRVETLGGLAVDAAGSAYISGATNSPDFPVTAGAFQTSYNASAPSYKGFVAKFPPDGTKLAYATYLGGSAADSAMAVAVDAAGNAYIGGTSSSPDFPLRSPIQFTPVNSVCYSFTPSGSIPDGEYPCASGGFLAVLNPASGDLVWSTYLGSGTVNALALDSASDVYATGLGIAPGSTHSVGVVKIAPGASALAVPPNAVVNAASFAPGLPLPGGLASVWVRGVNISGTVVGSGSPLPAQLAGVSIIVGGAPAPILAISPVGPGVEQINFQVPFEAASNAVEIHYQGSSIFAFPQTTGPGIFIASDGTPAIQHAADYSLVTPANPAHPGETIVVYATGLGKVSPTVASGVAASGPAAATSSCAFVYGSSLGSVLYVGLTPGAVGLYQMNIQLAQDLPAGVHQFSIYAPICNAFPPGNYLQGNSVDLPVQ